jgi:WhiB family redox-sensing transcriptional regulator
MIVDIYDLAQNQWKLRGKCREADADIFFPERGASTRKAKAVCRRCPVQEECLEYAVNNGEKFGIWGGLSERERRAIRKKRGIVIRELRFKR